MSLIGFALNPDTSRLLGEIDVPGEKVDHKHVTILMFGDDTPITTLSKILEVAYSVVSTTRPFTLRTNTVTSFPSNPAGTPVICKVESDELLDLCERLKTEFDKAGIEYSKKFPKFQPHVTLAYADKTPEDLTIPSVEWGAHELVIWGGNSGDQRVIINLPFSLKNRTASIVRRFRQQ